MINNYQQQLFEKSPDKWVGDEDDGDGDAGKQIQERPSRILHAPWDNISITGKSLTSTDVQRHQVTKATKYQVTTNSSDRKA